MSGGRIKYDIYLDSVFDPKFPCKSKAWPLVDKNVNNKLQRKKKKGQKTEGKGESRKQKESKGCVERKANSVGGIGMCLTSQGDWRYSVNHLSSFNRTQRFHQTTGSTMRQEQRLGGSSPHWQAREKKKQGNNRMLRFRTGRPLNKRSVGPMHDRTDPTCSAIIPTEMYDYDYETRTQPFWRQPTSPWWVLKHATF